MQDKLPISEETQSNNNSQDQKNEDVLVGSPQPPGLNQSQPSQIVASQEKEKKALKQPPKSFITAIITIALTIAVGIGLAILVKNYRSSDSPTSTIISPVVTVIPTTQQPAPVDSEQFPSSQKRETSGAFEKLLDPSNKQAASSSAQQKATQSAIPIE